MLARLCVMSVRLSVASRYSVELTRRIELGFGVEAFFYRRRSSLLTIPTTVDASWPDAHTCILLHFITRKAAGSLVRFVVDLVQLDLALSSRT